MNKLKLKWETEKRIINNLSPNINNPRSLSNKQEDDLKRSLEKFDLVEIPAINKDNSILAGHQRIKILQLIGRGEELIDVRVPNRQLTKKEADSYLIGSNSLGGDWDFELLKDFSSELLLDVGFEQEDLSKIWNDNLDNFDEDFDEKKEIEKVKETNIKVGDLILLGNHRLVCGDSNSPETLIKLFKNKKTSMIISDPIYNIDLDYNKGLGGKSNYGGNVNDKRTEDEYIFFLRENIKNALNYTEENCHIFYWNTEQQIWIIQTLYKELGIKNKRVCLWIKNGQSPTPQVAFSKCYEPCMYGTIGKPYLSKNYQGLNEVMNKDIGNGNDLIEDTNIWLSKRISRSEYKHATSKPVELYEKSIKRCTKVGDIIYDSFGGSGSTLIAGEKLKRKVYMIELEPIFCQLIVNRFEKLTGVKVKIINHGEKE